MAEVTVTVENFEEEVLKSDKTVLVDFWATWCGPCRMIAPIVSELAEEKADVLKVGKVDVDAETELAIRYNVQSIPTILIFKDGAVVNKQIGYCPKSALEALL